MFIVLSV